MSKRFPKNIERDRTLDTLLLLDGEVFPMDNGLRYIMTKHLVHVGIIPRQNYKKRTIAIAKGEYIPKPDEPKIWFESLKTMARYGIVELKKQKRSVKPIVKVTDFRVEFGLHQSFG